MYKFEDVSIKPTEEPETVALGKQTIDEVKATKPKLTFENDAVICNEHFPDLSKARKEYRFKKNMDDFALWRKLADVVVGDKNLEPGIFDPTKDLMDFLLHKLNKTFPKLKISWSEGTWNPVLMINESLTTISMEKLALAYQGLLKISEDSNAQNVICNIITKKLKELFV